MGVDSSTASACADAPLCSANAGRGRWHDRLIFKPRPPSSKNSGADARSHHDALVGEFPEAELKGAGRPAQQIADHVDDVGLQLALQRVLGHRAHFNQNGADRLFRRTNLLEGQGLFEIGPRNEPCRSDTRSGFRIRTGVDDIASVEDDAPHAVLFDDRQDTRASAQIDDLKDIR
jgi:hypothetical protein